MKALCKKNYYGFKKGEHYEVKCISSIFEANDFITLECSSMWYRFRMNQSLEYIDDYIGQNEMYFYDYFKNIQDERKEKLNQISKINS